MRALSVAVFVVLVAACQRQTEVRGLYVNDGKAAYVFSCDQLKTRLRVPDSALAAAYRLKVTAPGRALLVRLRGVTADSGSIYGGERYLLVSKVLEVREPTSGECPLPSNPFIPSVGNPTPTPKG